MAADTVQEQETVETELGGDSKRERSTILFPYGDLDSAVKVAKAVHQVGGTTCPLVTLAAELKVEHTGGGFRQLIYTAKIFGLVSYGQGSIQLTTLGSQVADTRQEKAARVTAFLSVPLYKALYERFRAGALPQPSALENEMLALGVAKKQTDKARQSFQRSALQAGFFAYGQDRLVMPAVREVKDSRRDEDAEEEVDETPRRRNARGDDDDGAGRHQLIAGLIKTLPQEGSEWGTDDRGKWLQAAATIFELIYKNTKDGRRVVTVKVEDSTK